MELITNTTAHSEYQLSSYDDKMRIWPYFGVTSWYGDRINSHRLKTAIQQIVDSVPILAGRLVQKFFSPLRVVCDPQKSGIGFIEFDLNDQEVNIDNLLDFKTYVNNVFNCPKKSSDAINTDTPLLYVVLSYHKNYSSLTLLINHCIADGATYFQLFKHLSKAYKDPEYVAKSEPLFTINFNQIDKFMNLNFNRLSLKDKILRSIYGGFLGRVYLLRLIFRDKSKWNYLICILTKKQLDFIKKETKNIDNQKVAYSTNDALFEFLSVVPVEIFSFPCNLRIRNLGISENYLGNAEFIVTDLTKRSNNYMLKHSDVRKSINDITERYSFTELFNEKYIYHNSWVKLQDYLPSFGGQLILQKVFQFDDRPLDILSFCWKGSLIYRAAENEYILIYCHLKNVVSQVGNKLINLGVKNIVIK